jgi:hypothetical protein
MKKLLKIVAVLAIVNVGVLSASEKSCGAGSVVGAGSGALAGAYICHATIGLGVLLSPLTGGASLSAAALVCAGEIIGGATTGSDVGGKVERIVRDCE